jgi:hypothetical protein
MSSAAFGQAQAVIAPVTAAAVVIGASTENVLRTGTPVNLKLSQELTTKEKVLRVGQRFQMEVSDPVMVAGQIVVPAGSPAVGEITEVRNKGMWGKSGHLTASILHLTVNGRQIRLTGTFDDKGVTGTGAVVGAVLLLPLAGFFTTGTSARIPMGAAVKGFIGEDVPLSFAKVAPTPMAVPATVPVATPATVPVTANTKG